MCKFNAFCVFVNIHVLWTYKNTQKIKSILGMTMFMCCKYCFEFLKECFTSFNFCYKLLGLTAALLWPREKINLLFIHLSTPTTPLRSLNEALGSPFCRNFDASTFLSFVFQNKNKKSKGEICLFVFICDITNNTVYIQK